MKKLKRIFELLPSIIEAVKSVENFIPIPKQGQAKLDTILGIIVDTQADVQDLIPDITRIIGRIVSLANLTGVFQSSK